MARFIRKSKDEIGRAPDELFHRGERKTEDVLIRIIDFDAKNIEENALKKIADAVTYQDKRRLPG